MQHEKENRRVVYHLMLFVELIICIALPLLYALGSIEIVSWFHGVFRWIAGGVLVSIWFIAGHVFDWGIPLKGRLFYDS